MYSFGQYFSLPILEHFLFPPPSISNNFLKKLPHSLLTKLCYKHICNILKCSHFLFGSTLQICSTSDAIPGQPMAYCSRNTLAARGSWSRWRRSRASSTFCCITWTSMLRLATSQAKKARGAPGPTWRILNHKNLKHYVEEGQQMHYVEEGQL